MNARLIDFLLRRSARERWLLGALVLVGVPLLLVFGLLLPLQDARTAAKAANREAVALNIWMRERVAEIEAAPAAAPRTATAPIGSSAIEESLIAAQLRRAVSELSAKEGGAIELQFDSVTFTKLANWIAANERGWGYVVSSFRFEASPVSGKVRARLLLSPAEG